MGRGGFGGARRQGPGRRYAVFRRVRGLVPLVDPASRVPLSVRFRLEEEEKEEEEEEDHEDEVFYGYGFLYVSLYWTGFGFQANTVEEYVLFSAFCSLGERAIVRQCLLRCFPLLGILVGMDQKDSVAVGCGRARRRYGSGMSIAGMLVTLLTLCFLRCRQAQMLCIMAGMDQKDSSQRHSFGFF